ncbi:MAG: hypothetical protein ACLQBJ_02995 [Bryobacteraceae bacterium]
MKLTIFVFSLLLALPALAGEGVDAAWKSLQSLAGEWQSDSGKASITYTLISNNTAVMESMKMQSEPDMVTMYHRDGAGLVATHYCSMGNQPRMRAPDADASTIRFRFADITNLAKPDGGHIKDLTVTFQDHDHMTQEWTSVEAGKEQVEVFHWTRKK